MILSSGEVLISANHWWCMRHTPQQASMNRWGGRYEYRAVTVLRQPRQQGQVVNFLEDFGKEWTKRFTPICHAGAFSW